MNMDLKQTFDSVKDGTREVAELSHEKANAFHETYVTKILPDCGKYGDQAKFLAEMLPGIEEYNALVDGDWNAFVLATGIDIGILVASAFTAGAAYAVAKGGSTVAKTGTKLAVKEIAEAGAKKAVKEGVEKTVRETAEKTASRGIKEVGEKIDKELVPKYLKEVEKITKREIKPQQMEKLKQALKEQDYVKLDPEKSKIYRRYFDKSRESHIKDWEKNTGDKWPVYAEDVLNNAGEVVRKAGQKYDAHHLIESSFGGPNVWWNLHPAAFPNEHQLGIHAANSIANMIF